MKRIFNIHINIQNINSLYEFLILDQLLWLIIIIIIIVTTHLTIRTNSLYTIQNPTWRMKWNIQSSLGFWDANWSPNPGQKTRQAIVNLKKKRKRIRTFPYRWTTEWKIKESEKRNKNLDLARELKYLRNMKVKVIPVVIGGLGTIPKVLVKGLEDFEIKEQMEINQSRALLRSARILGRMLGTCYHLNTSERLSAYAENSQRVT